jgi:hypothetical protein
VLSLQAFLYFLLFLFLRIAEEEMVRNGCSFLLDPSIEVSYPYLVLNSAAGDCASERTVGPGARRMLTSLPDTQSLDRRRDAHIWGVCYRACSTTSQAQSWPVGASAVVGSLAQFVSQRPP